MAKVRRVVVLFLLVLSVATLLGSCTLVKAIFGPNKNVITDWIPSVKAGTTLVYKFTWLDSSGNVVYTTTSKNEVTDVKSTDTKTVISVLETWPNGDYAASNNYIIADSNKDQLGMDSKDYLDSTSFIVLKVPVEQGTVWYDGTDKYQITATKQTKDVGAGTYKDAVEVKHTADGTAAYELLYYSPSGGYILDEIYGTTGSVSFRQELIELNIVK